MTQPPDRDDLDWDVERDGPMQDYATGPGGEPETEPYDKDEDRERDA